MTSFHFDCHWEDRPQINSEDDATFGCLEISYNHSCMTRADDFLQNKVVNCVHLSSYRLAEWLAWNWYRIRWEPRRDSFDWKMAHRMANVGGGYIWPNITIFSDCERIAVIAKPSMDHPNAPIRYTNDMAAIISADEFEQVTGAFINATLLRLEAKKIKNSNLSIIWHEVQEERENPDMLTMRKIEALLGFDPDSAEQTLLRLLIDDIDRFGEDAVTELAAASDPDKSRVYTSQKIMEMSVKYGVSRSSGNRITLHEKENNSRSLVIPAWTRGEQTARSLRRQEHIGTNPIANHLLTEWFGLDVKFLDYTNDTPDLSFALDEDGNHRVVLKQKLESGRRFALARIIGDQIMMQNSKILTLATDAYTDRQKAQRSFAAELLCPVEALEEFLDGDAGDDRIVEAAHHFHVSEYVVRHVLENHQHSLYDKGDLQWMA